MRFSFARARYSLILLLICAQHCAAQSGVAAQDILKPFTTDGCSLWIDGTPKHPYLWRHCCVAHDKSYWVGGPKLLRLAADNALHACVTELAGVTMANYMHFFVTTGGSPIWATPYRWGYGWSYMDAGKPRGYKLLTDVEQAQVAALMLQAEQAIAVDAQKHPSASTVLTGK